MLRPRIESGDCSRRAVAREAHRRYCHRRPASGQPSRAVFFKLVSGAGSDCEIERLLSEAGVLCEKKLPLDRDRVLLAFRRALSDSGGSLHRPLHVAERAHEIYGSIVGEERRGSIFSFQRLVYGRHADGDVKAILEEFGVSKRDKISRERMLRCFQEALGKFPNAGVIAIARAAHSLYVEGLPENSRPSEKTFRHLISGRSADGDVRALIHSFRKKNL